MIPTLENKQNSNNNNNNNNENELGRKTTALPGPHDGKDTIAVATAADDQAKLSQPANLWLDDEVWLVGGEPQLAHESQPE
eukprot:CAMPEP_0115137250 /NCGR_PEP_ID=MMETSP0227-20121206/56911_1 /TAXON_ID=89957 /ORGANISM="Polarella glacialis, Strain CCMP 1383" /LENGTH=80 /DNA_ID=CAMNT_0002544547 /DNA_START=138 /DNA_END=381 /DNA_ORIENTATION=+